MIRRATDLPFTPTSPLPQDCTRFPGIRVEKSKVRSTKYEVRSQKSLVLRTSNFVLFRGPLSDRRQGGRDRRCARAAHRVAPATRADARHLACLRGDVVHDVVRT